MKEKMHSFQNHNFLMVLILLAQCPSFQPQTHLKLCTCYLLSSPTFFSRSFRFDFAHPRRTRPTLTFLSIEMSCLLLLCSFGVSVQCFIPSAFKGLSYTLLTPGRGIKYLVSRIERPSVPPLLGACRVLAVLKLSFCSRPIVLNREQPFREFKTYSSKRSSSNIYGFPCLEAHNLAQLGIFSWGQGGKKEYASDKKKKNSSCSLL